MEKCCPLKPHCSFIHSSVRETFFNSLLGTNSTGSRGSRSADFYYSVTYFYSNRRGGETLLVDNLPWKSHNMPIGMFAHPVNGVSRYCVYNTGGSFIVN